MDHNLMARILCAVVERKHKSFSRLEAGEDWALLLINNIPGFDFFPILKPSAAPRERERSLKRKDPPECTDSHPSFFQESQATSRWSSSFPPFFVFIIYWIAGLKRSVANFFATLFTILLGVLVSQGSGLAVGALVLDQTSASTLGSVIMLCFLLTSGYFVQHVPMFIGWTKYLFIGTCTYKLLLISQYKATDTYPCLGHNGGVCEVGDFPAIKQVGLHGKVTAVLAMVAMLVGSRLVA